MRRKINNLMVTDRTEILRLKRLIRKSVVVISTGCWEWEKYRGQDKYGRISIQLNGKSISRQSHRVSFEVFKGEIPENKVVMHTCDNKPCCNPEHLIAGSHSDNHRDLISKGLKSKCKARSFSDSWLKRMRENMGLTQRELGKRLGVTDQCISDWECENRKHTKLVELAVLRLDFLIKLEQTK